MLLSAAIAMAAAHSVCACPQSRTSLVAGPPRTEFVEYTLLTHPLYNGYEAGLHQGCHALNMEWPPSKNKMLWDSIKCQLNVAERKIAFLTLRSRAFPRP